MVQRPNVKAKKEYELKGLRFDFWNGFHPRWVHSVESVGDDDIDNIGNLFWEWYPTIGDIGRRRPNPIRCIVCGIPLPGVLKKLDSR